MKLLGRLALVGGWIVYAIYTLYWVMFSSYMVYALTHSGGWRLWFDTTNQEGIAGPAFLWTLTLLNPFTLYWLCAKTKRHLASRNTGASLGQL